MNTNSLFFQAARSAYPTVLEMLTIEDPVIANALIDQVFLTHFNMQKK